MSFDASINKQCIGGTVLAVFGCTIFFTVVFNVADEATLTKARNRMTHVFPHIRHGMTSVFGIEPKAPPSIDDLRKEDEEMSFLELQLEESMMPVSLDSSNNGQRDTNP
jgi:hypothetical protein